MQVSSERESTIEGKDLPLQIGIVGCSLARPRYGAAFSLLPSVRVTAMSDADARLMRAWSRVLGGEIALFPDLDSLLASDTVPPALIIDVPLAERAEALLAAIPLCHALLCPPPFAPTLEETDRLLHMAEAHDTWLVPAFPRRFDPIIAQAIDLSTTGEIGLLHQVRCDWTFPLTTAYGAEIGADPDAGSWASLLAYTGCHAADVCRWCLGDVLTVSADIDIESLHSVHGSRRDAEALMAVFVIGHENGPATCHFARSRSQRSSERYIFSGSQGQLELVIASSANSADAFPTLTLHRSGQKPQPVQAPKFEDLGGPAQAYRVRKMVQDFADRACSTADAANAGYGARAGLEVVHAAYASAQDARKVALPLRRSPILPGK